MQCSGVQHLSEPFKSYESKYIPKKKKWREKNVPEIDKFAIRSVLLTIFCVYRVKESCILLRESATSWMILMFATVYCINIKLNVTTHNMHEHHHFPATEYHLTPSFFPFYRFCLVGIVNCERWTRNGAYCISGYCMWCWYIWEPYKSEHGVRSFVLFGFNDTHITYLLRVSV